MNILNKVTLKSLLRNRTRTIVTIIGIMLSAALICAVTTTIASFQNYIYENTAYESGYWHGALKGVDSDIRRSISESDEVESMVTAERIGYSKLENSANEYKPYLCILGAGENFSEMMPVHITEGEYPKNTGEILLPIHLSLNGKVQYNIGDTLTLDIGDRVSKNVTLWQSNPWQTYEDGKEVISDETFEVRESRTYTVVGFYERPSFEDYSAPGYTALTLEGSGNTDAAYDVYFKMNNAKDVYAYLDSFGHGMEAETNRETLLTAGVSGVNGFYTMLYSLAAIVTVLIMVGSVSLVYNAFSISVSERTRQFGILSSVGATKRQLRRMVFFEAFSVSVVGIPLGILVGIGGIGVTLSLIGKKFMSLFGNSIEMRLCISPAAIAIAVGVALITVIISAWIPSKRAMRVSAIEAIRQSADIKAKEKKSRTSRLTYFVFGLPGVLASKHYKRNRKKYRTTVFSLFISIVLFVSATAFTDYLTEAVTGGFSSHGYDIWFYVDKEDFEDSTVTKDELLEEVKNTAEVTGAAYTQRIVNDGAVDVKYLTDTAKDKLTYIDAERNTPNMRDLTLMVTFVNDNEFERLVKENGLKLSDYTDTAEPRALAAQGGRAIDAQEGRIIKADYLKDSKCEVTLYSEKEYDGYVRVGYETDDNDNTFYLYEKEDDRDDTLRIPKTEATETYTLKTAGVISELPYYADETDELVLLYPLSMKEHIAASSSIHNREDYRYYVTSDNHTKSSESIKKLFEDCGIEASHIFDIAESAETERNMITIVKVFAYGFIVLISLIAAANVFNTISTNISLRRREFAMLKSVGMTASGFNRMMNFECLLYGTRALLFGLPVASIVAYLIYRAVSETYMMQFVLPWRAIGIVTLSVFAVVFTTMMYSMSKIKKDNPIDALKNENL